MSNERFEQIGKRFTESSGVTDIPEGDVRDLSAEAIREAVFKDCRSPAFRKKLWDAAKEFEARVFGPEAIAPRVAA